MGKYQLSKAAQFDIDDLYAGGVLKYGLCQADKYYDGLIERFEFLTENSNIGLNSDELAPNLQRFPYRKVHQLQILFRIYMPNQLVNPFHHLIALHKDKLLQLKHKYEVLLLKVKN